MIRENGTRISWRAYGKATPRGLNIVPDRASWRRIHKPCSRSQQAAAAIHRLWVVDRPVCLLPRTNPAQEQAASIFGVCQATASRRWDLLRGEPATALSALVPSVREVVGRDGSVLLEGFLAPTWDWKRVDGMYSDKHGQAGFNIQVAASISGDIAALGAPVPGARRPNPSASARRSASHPTRSSTTTGITMPRLTKRQLNQFQDLGM